MMIPDVLALGLGLGLVWCVAWFGEDTAKPILTHTFIDLERVQEVRDQGHLREEHSGRWSSRKVLTYTTETLMRTTEKLDTHIHIWKACIQTSETFFIDYWNAFTHTSKMCSYTQLKNSLSHTHMKLFTYYTENLLYWKWKCFTHMCVRISV